MDSSIQQVKDQHTAELLAMPGVVSVGLGKGREGGLAIIVGVESDSVDVVSAIPNQLNGYLVEVQVAGSVSAQ